MKYRGDPLGPLPVVRFGTEQQQRQIGDFAADVRQQGYPGMVGQPAVSRIAAIGDNPIDVLPVTAIEGERGFVRGSGEDFGSGPHLQQAVFGVQAFAKHRLGLADHLFVKQRQKEGAIEGRIFDEQQDADRGQLRCHVPRFCGLRGF